jgi:hypothetical protein
MRLRLFLALAVGLASVACSSTTIVTNDGGTSGEPTPPANGDDAGVAIGTDGPFKLSLRGTGYPELREDSWYVVRDVETKKHVAWGLITGKDTATFETKAVLEKGHAYQLGISIMGKSYCITTEGSTGLSFVTIPEVTADVVLERAFTEDTARRACDVIAVKSALPPGDYDFKFAGGHIELAIGPSGAAYAAQMGFKCVTPTSATCHGVGAGSNCAYAVDVEEDGTIAVGAGGNDTGLNATFTPTSDGFTVKGSVSGCCNEPFSGTVTRTGVAPTTCK